MNTRPLYTLALSAGFLCLAITGILMYSQTYQYVTAGLHIWSSVLVLFGVFGHFKNNWQPYKHHLKKRFGKMVLILCSLGVVPITLALSWDIAPISSLVALGENLRGSNPIREGEYQHIDLAPQHSSAQKLSLFIKAGSEYQSEPQPLYWGLTYTATPQIAVWLEDREGQYIKTLYVTGKTAESGFYSAKEGEGRVRRPETLPYWSHKRGVQAADGLYVPDQDSTAFDGRTAATPKSDHLLSLENPTIKGLDIKDMRLMVEINRSYDFNQHYHKQAFPNDPIYSGSGSSGQPSLIYQAELKAKQPQMLKLIGHGHHSGQTGELYRDLSGITTAKQIVDFMVVNKHH